MSLRGKRKYNRKIFAGLEKNKEQLIDFMKAEWDEAVRKTSRDEMVRRAMTPMMKSGEILLKLLLVGGICATALVAPKVFVVFSKQGKRRYFVNEHSAKRSLYYLKQRKCVDLERGQDGDFEIVITEKGLRLALQKGFSEIQARNKMWDGSWRLVIFDIPEKHKTERDGFREKLKHLGFRRLQQSVFVSPYECEKEVEFFASVFGIVPFITFIKTKYISCESALLGRFHLG